MWLILLSVLVHEAHEPQHIYELSSFFATRTVIAALQTNSLNVYFLAPDIM
jgi:hypothetical protein